MRDGMLEFKDAPMFGRVMRDPEICKGVLERILGFEIARVEYLNTEQAFDPATDAKGVRLDVFAKADGRVFDIEMQISTEAALGRRMRYYQSIIDQVCLEKGERYSLLEESYIIFLCDFDPYLRDIPVYHLERTCSEDASVEVDDRSHWLVLNACAWEKDADVARSALLEYVHASSKDEDGLIRRIDASVQRANDDEHWRVRAMSFMTLEHSHLADIDFALERGRKEGLEQGRELEAVRYSALVDALLDANRIEDLKCAAEDPAYRQELFEEFHIS